METEICKELLTRHIIIIEDSQSFTTFFFLNLRSLNIDVIELEK